MSEQSESIGKLVTALVNVQGAIKPAKKESENPFFHSKYADLGAVWEVCRDLLTKNGLVVIQTTKVVGENVALVSTLAHISGEWIRGELLLIPVKRDPQGIGSSISYGRRYALAALLGIVADEDDDGNAASNTHQAAHISKPSPSPVKSAPAKPSGHSSGPLERITTCFELSEPIKSKTGKIFRKAIDLNGDSYFVWADEVCADLQLAGGSEVTVEYEAGAYPTLKRVLKADEEEENY